MGAVEAPLHFRPPRVYVLKNVWDNPQAARRAERVAAACIGAEVRTVDYADMPDIVVEEKWDHFGKMGTMNPVPTAIPVLGLFQFDQEKANATAQKMKDAYKGDGHFHWHHLAGALPFSFFCSTISGFDCKSLDEIRPNPEHVCRPQWRIRQGIGCPHQCAYCSLGGSIISHLNTEEYIDHLAKLLAENPWQKTWLYDDCMDVPTLEPQLDTLAPLMRFFESTQDRYLIIHTKTDRAQAFTSANAPRNTIVAWSLSGPTQSRHLEKEAGNTESRVEAARQCQDAGLTIRYKFKPIVPIRNWREEAAYTIDHALSRTRPDNLSMTALMWMKSDGLQSCIPSHLLDPEFAKAAEDAKNEIGDSHVGPFPHEKREEIYRHYLAEVRKRDKHIPLIISTESMEMWKSLGEDLGFTPGNYVCGCGAGATPQKRVLDSNPWEDAKQGRTWDGKPAIQPA